MAAARTLVAVIAAFLAVSARASKYTREANEGLADAKRREAGEFRVVRLNQVWEKAQRVSGAAREELLRGGGEAGRAASAPEQPAEAVRGRQWFVCGHSTALPGPSAGLGGLLPGF